MIVDVGLIGGGCLESPLGGIVGIPSLGGHLGQTIGVEVSSIELVVLFVQHGIDDGHFGGPGRLDGGWVPHVLQTTMADPILDQFVVTSTEGENGFNDISLASVHVLGGGVGGIPFRVGHLVYSGDEEDLCL